MYGQKKNTLLKINYSCISCGVLTNNQKMKSMVCKCGGDFRPIDLAQKSGENFDSYFDPTVKKYITSWREQEKIGKNFKNAQHPEGLTLVQANTKFNKELAYIRKHKADYIKAQYAKDTKNEPVGRKSGKYYFTV